MTVHIKEEEEGKRETEKGKCNKESRGDSLVILFFGFLSVCFGLFGVLLILRLTVD